MALCEVLERWLNDQVKASEDKKTDKVKTLSVFRDWLFLSATERDAQKCEATQQGGGRFRDQGWVELAAKFSGAIGGRMHVDIPLIGQEIAFDGRSVVVKIKAAADRAAFGPASRDCMKNARVAAEWSRAVDVSTWRSCDWATQIGPGHGVAQDVGIGIISPRKRPDCTFSRSRGGVWVCVRDE